MENEVLKTEQLAERWQISKSTIENLRRSGAIQPIKALLPSVRYSLNKILEVEGVTKEEFKLIEKKNMQLKIERLKKENTELKKVLIEILNSSSKVSRFLDERTITNE